MFDSSEKCAICQDIYNDPCMTSDGYCYCRKCIAHWVKGKDVWRSPLLNMDIHGEAMLIPDRLRACRAKTLRREHISKLPWISRFIRTATERFGERPLATPEQCLQILEDSSIRKVGQWGDACSHILLELCWLANDLEKYPGFMVAKLCRSDRKGPQPFIVRKVLEDLLLILVKRFESDPTYGNECVARICRDHLTWRYKQIDAIWIPSQRRNGVYESLFKRSASNSSEPFCIEFIGATGKNRLKVNTLNDDEACIHELTETALYNDFGEQRSYRSNVPVLLKGLRLWTKRRGYPPVLETFPDNTVEIDSDQSDVDEESETQNTEEIQEDSDNMTIERKIEESLKTAKLSIWEKNLDFLPIGFEYVPRVREEDELSAETELPEIINKLFLNGFLKRSVPTVSWLRRNRRRTS